MRRKILTYLLALTLGLTFTPVPKGHATGMAEDMVLIPAGAFIMGSRQSLIELDPDYHLFRKLKPDEVMPTSIVTRRSEKLLIVVPR